MSKQTLVSTTQHFQPAHSPGKSKSAHSSERTLLAVDPVPITLQLQVKVAGTSLEAQGDSLGVRGGCPGAEVAVPTGDRKQGSSRNFL